MTPGNFTDTNGHHYRLDGNHFVRDDGQRFGLLLSAGNRLRLGPAVSARGGVRDRRDFTQAEHDDMVRMAGGRVETPKRDDQTQRQINAMVAMAIGKSGA